MAERQRYSRQVCAGCGEAALVDAAAHAAPYRCARCTTADTGVTAEELAEMQVRRFWTDNRANAGMGGAFAALDAVFNPAAARAQEQVRGDHERHVPNPTPGDDALRRGSLVIRVERPQPPSDV